MKPEDHQKVLILGAAPNIAVRHTTAQSSVTLYGSPNLGGRTLRNDDALVTGMVRDPARVIQQLDGEFVLIVESPDQVHVATDRFSSTPLFYLADDRTLVLSFSYRSIWKWLSDRDNLKVDSLAFFESLYFQRLFGETTFDRSTRALPPATLLSFNRATGKTTANRYWTPDFTKRSDGRRAIANELADAVRGSVATKTAGANRPALLLSGGMDSRVVLGGFPESAPPLCITVGEVENNEVDVARSLANISGADHSFVQRSASHYTDIVQEAVATGSGMYSFQHGHFFGLDFPETDLILHGHGFDYFFQGMYLPSRRRTFLGRNTRSWALEPIGSDLVERYMRRVKYRLKGIDSFNLLQPEFIDQATERLRADLSTVLAPIAGQTAEPYDQWDYLTTSATGRHYTYLNLLSAGSLAEQRTVAFTNDIFNIYYATPAEVRHGTLLLAETLSNLNPRLLGVRNANTNLRPDRSPARLTVDGWVRGAKRRLGLAGPGSADPEAQDRSWPTDAMIVQGSTELASRIDRLADSDGIASLDIFDRSKIADLATSSRNGNHDAASALLSLLTIDEFLSSNRSTGHLPNA